MSSSDTDLNAHGKAGYFPAPYSIDHLPKTIRYGLIPVGIFASLSFASSLLLIIFIVFRTLKWRSYYRNFIGHNQYIMLVLNLVFADLQQSSAFLISFHWIRKDAILAPSPACFAQGWLLHSGDVSSGFFVLAIAVHTYWTAVLGKRLSNTVFYTIIVCIWLFAYFLTFVGVAMHSKDYFVRAGAWCWVSNKYENDRLGLHYIWVFIDEFGTIVLYVVTFFVLRWKTSRLFRHEDRTPQLQNQRTIDAVNRVTTMMMLYPCAYVLLTLPLSAGRMWSMAHGGDNVSDAFACAAGALLTSCGWVDSLLYTLTRKKLLKDTQGNSTGRRSSVHTESNFDQSHDKTITHTRTVTVVEEEAPHTPPQQTNGRAHMIQNQNRNQHDDPDSISGCEDGGERPASPSGSIDPILSNQMHSRFRAEATLGDKEMLEHGRRNSFELGALGKSKGALG